MLTAAGVVGPQDVDAALEQRGARSLAATLVAMGLADEPRIARAIAQNAGLDYIDLAATELDPTAATLVPIELVRRHRVLPVRISEDRLVLAMADPADIFAIDDVRLATGYEMSPVVAGESDIASAIERLASMQENVGAMVEGSSTGEVDEEEEEADVSGEAPVAKIVNNIIAEAIRRSAGDIYIEPLERELRVRYRIDGVCQEVMRSPKKVHRPLISRVKITSGMDIAEKRLPQDGRFSVTLDGRAVDFRVAVLPTVNGEMAVLRLLRKDSILMSLEDLGFLAQPLERIMEAISRPYGALLVTGPTGSGKSTTLYAAINKTTGSSVNLITVEDPVEYRLEGLSQVQVNEKAGLTFASALRSILRQDPDVVMVGEIRDKETATIAIEAALTGHLVLSTLHTNDAPSALTRLTEMGVEPFLTASAVNCVLAQRLARRLCKECKEAYTPDAETLDRLGFPYDRAALPTLYRARGCNRCGGIGYRGRIGVHEVMTMTEEIERACVNHASGDEIARIAIEQGMKTLRDDGFEKVLAGTTSIEGIMRVVV
jgi:type IV pilus assembly protein PilB